MEKHDERFINLPFYKKASKKILDFDQKYSEICQEYERIGSMDFFWREKVEEFIKRLENFLETIINTKTDDEFEKIILQNLKDRIISQKGILEKKTNPDMSYPESLGKIYGIGEKETEIVKKYAENIKLKKIFEEVEKYSYSFASLSTEEEIEKIFSFSKKFLKKIYNENGMNGDFKEYEDYIKTIEFSKMSGNSYHFTGKVVLSANSMRNVQFYDFKSSEFKRYPDVIQLAELIGEETLLGHQGHYLLTKNLTNLKLFTYSGLFEKCSTETVTLFGKYKGSELLIKNLEEFPDLCPKNLAKNLKEFYDLEKELNFINSFGRCFSNILFSKNKLNESFSYFHKLLDDPYYDSKKAKVIIRNYYECGNFYREEAENQRRFIYLISYINERRISDMLKKLPKEKSIIIEKYMRFGYWSISAFEMYLKFLINKVNKGEIN